MSDAGGLDWPVLFTQLHAAAARSRGEVPATRARLERARSLIHADPAAALDLEALARAAHFSRHHFLRAFRREFELTPHQYLTHRRLELAKQLLAATDLPVTEVCLAVGFSSLGSFSSLFRRHVGHPPSRYRARVFACPGVVRPVLVPGCFLARYAPNRGPAPVQARALRAAAT